MNGIGGRTRAAGVAARLVLIAAVVFGIFVMHTLGHPGGSSGGHGGHGGGHDTGSHASAPYEAAGTTSGEHHAMPEHAASVPSHPASVPERAASVVTGPYGLTAPDNPGDGMDMTGLCLAVLSVWALAGLLCGVLRRLRGRPLNLLSYAVLTHRPNPPPRPPALAELSILRI
ncbi:hypothetical protein [Streptomyces sp. ODS28]|uniref:hypothetical protein n=1 Tax=Streptomyces sp. ODS28 TaxID=3136688 RepID=UPI0031E74782